MKNAKILSVITLMTAAYMMAGCASGTGNELNYNETDEISVEEEVVTTPAEDTTGEYIISDDGPDVCDGMKVWGEDAKEFYIMRVKDDYIEIPGECQWVYYEDTGEYPELEDGQIASVVADVRIYDGGVAGYMHNIFITDLKSYEVMDYSDVVDVLDIPKAGSEEFAYDRRMFEYIEGDAVFLIVKNRQYNEIYLNGSPFFEYDPEDYEDEFEPLFNALTN